MTEKYVMRDVMKSGEHYGAIPGCGDKAVLLKPGAEKLMLTFRLANDVEVDTIDLHLGHREYRVKVTLYSPTGQRLGTGVGSCSTMESVYDRTGYVGAADIAGCPRKATLGKQHPTSHDVTTLLRFSRGHAAQAMYAAFFSAGGALFEEEVEVRHPDIPEIKCHIDFLFYANRQTKRLHIVEMKSTDGIPDEPYASWVDQLHVQMGLLQLNLDPEVEIGGSILVVDLNAGIYHEFNSYAPNKLVFEQLVAKGQHILAAVRGECVPRTEPGILCGYCPYRTGCPAHAVTLELPREILEAGRKYLELNTRKKELESRLNVLKSDILTFADGTFKGAADGILINVTSVADQEHVQHRRAQGRHHHRTGARTPRGPTGG